MKKQPNMPPPLPPIPPIDLDGFELDMQYYIQKEYLDIAQAAVELPSIIEAISAYHQVVTENKIRTKARLEQRESRALFELKGGEFQSKGYGDKITEASLKAAVVLDDEVMQLTEEFAVWSALEDRLERSGKALLGKLDIVRSSEATRRKVFGNEG